MNRLSEVQLSARSPSDPSSPPFFSENATGTAPPADPNADQVVENWMSKARDSLAEFGGLIGMGGGGKLNQFIVDRDPELISSDEDSDDEYGFAIIDSEGNNVQGEQNTTRLLTHRRSTSSIGSDKNRRQDGNASANLPSQAVPFGLMANLSLKAQKVRGDPSEEFPKDSNLQSETLGVARDDFFHTRKDAHIYFHINSILTSRLQHLRPTPRHLYHYRPNGLQY